MMSSIVFLACIVFLVRASPPNDGMPLSEQLFPIDLSRLILLHALIIRPLPNYIFNTFGDSFLLEADNALDEILSHPTFDLFPLSNDFHRSSKTIEYEWEPIDFDLIEKSSSELQASKKYLWNDLEPCERAVNDIFVNELDNPVDDQDVPVVQHLGAGQSPQPDEEPNAVNEQDAEMQETGIVTSCIRQ